MPEIATAEVSLGWSNETLPLGSHVCFYYLNDEMLKRTVAFLKMGLDEPKTFCVIFADPARSERVLAWLEEAHGREIRSLIERGKLGLIGGASTVDGLLASIRGRLEQAVKDGYTLIRFLGFIGWGQPGWPNDRDLLEFEAKVNYAVTAYPAVIICTYGVPSLPGTSLIYGGLQTHPITMLAGVTERRNPYYVVPGEFLERLSEPT